MPMYLLKHRLNMAILYHNPRCSKSRQALELCEGSDVEVEVRLYLSNPLSIEELTDLLSRLEGPVHASIRTKDPKFKLADTASLDVGSLPSVVDFLALNGHLMERPILDNGAISCVGRPLEDLQRLL